MKKSLMLGAAAVALLGTTALSHAAGLGTSMPMADIVLPTGAWFNSVTDVVIAVVPTVTMGVLTWALNKYLGIKLDAHYSDYIQGMEVNVLQAARNRLQAKVPDKTVIPTQSELLSEGAQYFIDTEAPALVKWFGGFDGIVEWLEGHVNAVPASEAAAAAAAAPMVPATPVVTPATAK